MEAHLGQAPAEQHQGHVWRQGDDEQATSPADHSCHEPGAANAEARSRALAQLAKDRVGQQREVWGVAMEKAS